MTSIPARLRRAVLKRAQARCEYCRLSQAGQEATFHIDHIVPRVEAGRTRADNLALACVSGSLRKEARQKAPDPRTGNRVAVFNPRRQPGSDHFRWDGVRIVGITATGRATVSAFRMNRLLILAIREEEFLRGRLP